MPASFASTIADHETLAKAYGLAHRGYAMPNTVDARFALASMTKGFTALAVVSLIEQGTIELGTTARSLLGTDLPMIAEDVTIEHLLAHRSGIGDYLDEELHPDVAEYVMPVPVHELASAEDYLAVLDGHEAAFAPGTQFAYNNGAYVVLAILAERAGGVPYHDLLAERVFRRAGMDETDFPRSDELAGAVAQGYIEVDGRVRSNVAASAGARRRRWRRVLDRRRHARRSGPRCSTAASWRSSGSPRWSGHAAPCPSRADATGSASGSMRRATSSSSKAPMPGSRARSVHDPATGVTYTVISNSSDGAWPILELLADRLGTAAEGRAVDEAGASA